MHNDAVNAILLGQEFAARMEAQFQTGIEAAKPVGLEEWQGRPVRDRVLQTVSRWVDDWL